MSSSRVDVTKVQRVACIGAGPIGAGWSAYFLANGFDVSTYIHDVDEERSLRALIDNAWLALEEIGLAEAATGQGSPFTLTSPKRSQTPSSSKNPYRNNWNSNSLCTPSWVRWYPMMLSLRRVPQVSR